MYKYVILDECSSGDRYMNRKCFEFNAMHRYSVKTYNYKNIFGIKMICVCVLDYYHGVVKTYHFKRKSDEENIIKFDKVLTNVKLFVKKRCK